MSLLEGLALAPLALLLVLAISNIAVTLGLIAAHLENNRLRREIEALRKRLKQTTVTRWR